MTPQEAPNPGIQDGQTIRGDLSVVRVLSLHPCLAEVFRAHGLGNLVAPQIRAGLPPSLTLRSALAALDINEELFLDHLRSRIATAEQSQTADHQLGPGKNLELTVSALLPCGMKMPFNRALDAFIEAHNRTHQQKVRYLVEGNVNHEISFYDRIDSLTSLDELPDIIISADINSFYHRPFKDAFRGKNLFHCADRRGQHPDMDALGLADPSGDFTMLSANLLVIVVIDELLGRRARPASWGDLLDESFADSVVMRGDNTFFCNGVLLPFFRMFGMEGIRHLGRSVVRGLHPSEMVKMIDSRSPTVPPAYVMPYFFAMKVKERQRISIIVPPEGALVSPVQMLVKRSAPAEVMAVADYLAGPEMGQICADAHFPSTHPAVTNTISHLPLYWLGWDFLNGQDIGGLKSEIAATFRRVFATSGGRACGC